MMQIHEGGNDGDYSCMQRPGRLTWPQRGFRIESEIQMDLKCVPTREDGYLGTLVYTYFIPAYLTYFAVEKDQPDW